MEPTNEIRRMEIDQESIDNLNITRKWTMFLSILGFIAVALIILAGLSITALMPLLGTTGEIGAGETMIIMVMMILISALYFFPVLFLFRFSNHTKNAVNTWDHHQLGLAFKNLKSCFRFIGIMTIIILVLYILVIIIAGAASFAFLNAAS